MDKPLLLTEDSQIAMEMYEADISKTAAAT
jgi:hypothetical protein